VAKAAGKKEARPFTADDTAKGPQVHKAVPPELKCTLCKHVFNDCVSVGCCGWSYCDECIRQHMIGASA